MAESILSQASKLGYAVPGRIESIDSKVEDFELTPELVITSNFNKEISENVNFPAFLSDLTKVGNNLDLIYTYVEKIRCCAYLPVSISRQKQVSLSLAVIYSRLVKDIFVDLSKAVSSSSNFTMATLKRQHIRELSLKTVKNFESITFNNADFCQQLEDLCTTLSS